MQYDNGSGMGSDETLPFMKPLDEAKMEELTAADKAWSGWLAMEDWMLGPRAPADSARATRTNSFSERRDYAQASGSGTRSGYQDLPNGAVESVEEL